MTAIGAVRLTVIVIAAAAATAWWLVWWRCALPVRARAVLPGLWALHVLVFTVVAKFRLLPAVDLNLWSSAVRIHGLIASIVLAVDYLVAECNRA
jgi:hypothetical protein